MPPSFVRRGRGERSSQKLTRLGIFESSSSIASVGDSGVRTLRSTHTRVRSSLAEEELLLARAALADVNRREHAAIGELAIEVNYRVAGALELLEDDFVHARAGTIGRMKALSLTESSYAILLLPLWHG